jgi:uncharacterized protein (TIGR02246 family)
MSFPKIVPFLFLLFLPNLLLGQASLSNEDIGKIREVHRQYERAWLENDANGVRSLFTEDSVLLPHHGDPPRVGRKDLNAFWFPRDSPPTTIDKLELHLREIGGEGRIAYVWGTDEVAWTTIQNGKSVKVHNAGTFLNVLKKQADGSWKISHHMWDDPLPQTR